MKKEWNYLEETRKEGLEQGIEEGFQQDIQQDIEEGRKEDILISIQSMIENNLSLETISKYLNMPLNSVEQYIKMIK